MICPSRTSGQALRASRLISAELTVATNDSAAGLSATDRRWLADLSTALEAEASRWGGEGVVETTPSSAERPP